MNCVEAVLLFHHVNTASSSTSGWSSSAFYQFHNLCGKRTEVVGSCVNFLSA